MDKQTLGELLGGLTLPEMKTASSPSTLDSARQDLLSALESGFGADKTSSGAPDPVADVQSAVGELAQAAEHAVEKEAALYGRSMADSFVERLGEWGFPVLQDKTASDAVLEKLASDNPAMLADMEKLGYEQAKQMVKLSEDTGRADAQTFVSLVKEAQEQGQRDAQTFDRGMKTAAYNRGYQVAQKLLDKTSADLYDRGYRDTVRIFERGTRS